jgi:hypothetical protein
MVLRLKDIGRISFSRDLPVEDVSFFEFLIDIISKKLL